MNQCDISHNRATLFQTCALCTVGALAQRAVLFWLSLSLVLSHRFHNVSTLPSSVCQLTSTFASWKTIIAELFYSVCSSCRSQEGLGSYLFNLDLSLHVLLLNILFYLLPERIYSVMHSSLFLI